MYLYHAYASDRLHNATTVPCNLKKKKKKEKDWNTEILTLNIGLLMYFEVSNSLSVPFWYWNNL